MPVARDFAPGWRRGAPLGLKQYAGDPRRCDAPLGFEQHAEDDPRRRTLAARGVVLATA